MTAYRPEDCFANPGRLVLGPTRIAPSAPPPAPVVNVTGGGSVTPGVHMLAFSFLYGSGAPFTGESTLGTHLTVTLSAGQQAACPGTQSITLPSGATGIALYATKAGGAVFYLVNYDLGASPLAPTRSFSAPDAALVSAWPGTGTPLPSAYPFGGTALGVVSRVELEKRTEYAWALSEARGRDRVQGWRGATWASLAFVLEQYDPTVLNLLWASNTTSPNGYGGANILSLPQPGLSLEPGAITPSAPLLFDADDPQKPSALVLSPLWSEEEREKWAFSLNVPLQSVVAVMCGLDAGNLDLRIDKIENLSLT